MFFLRILLAMVYCIAGSCLFYADSKTGRVFGGIVTFTTLIIAFAVEDETLTILGVIGVILLIVVSIINIKEYIGKKQEQQSIHTKENAKAVYCELKKLNCYPLTDANQTLIEATCTKFKVNVSKLKELSDMGYNIVRESEYNKDISERCGNQYHLEDVGVIKYTKHILFDIEMKLHKAYKVLHSGNEYLQKKSETKAVTHDWATWGGIANGIAGGAAGVSVAIDTQIENQKAIIRAKETREKAINAITEMSSFNSKLSVAVEKVKNDILEMEKSVTHNVLYTEFDCSRFIVTEYSVTESGSLVVDLNFKTQQKANRTQIFDGVVLIKVLNKEQVVGEGYISTPGYILEDDLDIFDEIGFQQDFQKTVRCFPSNNNMFSSDETYTFEFVAKNLWMVNITEMQEQYAKVLKTLEAYQDTENKIMREVFVKTMTI